MPKHDYVINLEHNIMTTYHYKMHQEDLAKQFADGIDYLMETKRQSVYWE